METSIYAWISDIYPARNAHRGGCHGDSHPDGDCFLP